MLKSYGTLSLRSFRGAHSVRVGSVDQPGSRANPSKQKSAGRGFRFLCRLTSWFCDGGGRRKCRIFLERGTTHTRGRITPPACNFISSSFPSIPVPTSQALERVQRTTDGPSTPLALPRCAYGTARCGHTTRPRTTRSTRARRFLAPTCRRVIDGTPRRPRRPSSRPPRSRSARGRRRGL